MPPMVLKGLVTKVGCMQKTATVTVSRWMVHPKTHKRIERSKKYLTHDPTDGMKLGDTVTIQNCPPVSARKRFKLLEILKSPETEWILAHPELANVGRKTETKGSQSHPRALDREHDKQVQSKSPDNFSEANPLLAHLSDKNFTGNPLLPHTATRRPPSA